MNRKLNMEEVEQLSTEVEQNSFDSYVEKEEIQADSSNLSKNQLKRIKRQEKFQLAKKAKKEKKKAEKLAQLEDSSVINDSVDISATILPGEVSPSVVDKVTNGPHRKQDRTDRLLNLCASNFHVIIDCEWEKDHSESSLKSLTQQIMFCYGFNRGFTNPAMIHLCNLGSRTIENLTKVKFTNWMGVTTSQEDYLLNEQFSIGKEPNKKQLVYLTSDAEETLETLSPDEAYIIGGIVDRNRLKGITYQKAKLQGIRTAKLPIKEHFALSATHILTVNHVFEILLRFSALQNWCEVLKQVLPKRKDPKQQQLQNSETTNATSEENELEIEQENEESDDDNSNKIDIQIEVKGEVYG